MFYRLVGYPAGRIEGGEVRRKIARDRQTRRREEIEQLFTYTGYQCSLIVPYNVKLAARIRSQSQVPNAQPYGPLAL